jgi:hypothetical protein
MPDQNEFRGWAKVEVMGHQSHIGYVVTEVYGQACMFRVDSPAVPESEVVLAAGSYDDEGRYCPAGSTVKRHAIEAVTVLIGSGSIYRIIPCTEEVALAAIRPSRTPFSLIKLPETVLLNPGETPVQTGYADDDIEGDGKDY